MIIKRAHDSLPLSFSVSSGRAGRNSGKCIAINLMTRPSSVLFDSVLVCFGWACPPPCQGLNCKCTLISNLSSVIVLALGRVSHLMGLRLLLPGAGCHMPQLQHLHRTHTFVIWRIRGSSTHPHLSQSWAWSCLGLRADPLNRWIPMSTFLIYFCQSACPASLTDFKSHLSVCLCVFFLCYLHKLLFATT